MFKIVRAVTVLLSIFMVFAPLSASACDLSCWLHPTASDCHSTGPARESSHMMMSGSSAMDMSAEADMSPHRPQAEAAADYNVSTPAHHRAAAQMDMVDRSLEVMRKPDVISGSGFDHSKKLSRCSHEICTQISASPPRASGHQPAYLLHTVAIEELCVANCSSNAQRRAPGTPLPIILAVELLTTLRI